MPDSFRNSFTSGVLDPKLACRSDLEQYRTGLRTGTNVLLLPHGGARRRPGTRYVAEAAEQGRLARFRFNLEQQYLFHFRNLLLDIYEDDDLLTTATAPWPTAVLDDIYTRGQTADTMVVCHQSYAPHRILRAALANNPIRTDTTTNGAGLTTLTVEHPSHGLLAGDKVAFSGLAGTPVLNVINGVLIVPNVGFQSHTIALVSGSLPTDPATTTSSDTTIRLIVPNHVFTVNERITVEGLVGAYNIPDAELNRTHTIDAIGGSGATKWVEFEVDSVATTTDTTVGGAAGTWKSPDLYKITVTGTASSSGAGGGANGRAWVIQSLAPDDDRRVAFEDLPQFDFEDEDSPPPARAVQRLLFTDFTGADTYVLTVSVPRYKLPISTLVPIFGQNNKYSTPTTIRTAFLPWDGTPANNATIIQEAINGARGDGSALVTVEYDLAGSTPPTYEYIVRFNTTAALPAIQVYTIKTTGNAQIDVDVEVEGGSTEEDVISAARGWPAGCIFYERRLWLFGLASRPSTVLASKIEDFFNFDVGSALDGDAIDATGEFDAIRHLIAERGLFMLTAGSEVQIAGGGDDQAVTPSNINLKVATRYGSNSVPPISVAGRPMYVDRIARNIRQLGAAVDSPTGQVESKELSILSQHLINDPIRLELCRTADGDYCYVLNVDGTMAVLNINVDQGVAGWTEITTDGEFLDACEVDDTLYVTVQRNINGTPTKFIEAFDYDYYTDCAAQTGGSANVYSHLNGETVAVRADGQTMESAVVAANAVAVLSGDVPITATLVEAGLAIPTPTVEPMPPQLSAHSAIVKATVDLFESREVYVDGYQLRPYLPGEAITSAASPAITGFREIQLRGWSDRASVAITSPHPQPMTVRAIQMEIA